MKLKGSATVKQKIAGEGELSDNRIILLARYTETDPTVPSWAKAGTKPSYTAQEVGAMPAVDDVTLEDDATNGGVISLYDTSANERTRLTAEGLNFYNASGAQTAFYPATGTWSMVGNKTGATNSLTGLTINLGVVTASDMGIANNASASVVAGGWLSYCTAKYPNAKQCIFEGVAIANSYRMMRCMIYDTADKSGIQPNVATGQMQFYDGATTLFGTQNYNVWTRDVSMSARVYA